MNQPAATPETPQAPRSSETATPAGLPRPVPVLRWIAGRWERADDAVSPETRVLCPDDGDELWAWPEDPDMLRLGHALLEQRNARLSPLPEGSEGVLRDQAPAPDEPAAPPPEALLALMETFLSLPGRYPRLWEETGCFHRAAAVRGNEVLCLAEDIGRHNCIDRLAGWAWQAGVALESCLLFLSARITGSLYERARLAGFRFLVSRAAVTTAATDGARKDGVTLVGFCRPREKRFTVFAAPAGRMRA